MLWALALAVSAARPAASAWLPDFVRVQYAGQSGFIALGAGYAWLDGILEPSLNYGYAPGFVAERPIHTLAIRNAASPARLRLPYRLDLEPLVAGFAANVSLGDRFQLYVPKKDGGYYWPDALYFWLFAGAKLGYSPSARPFPERIGFQLEIGTLNQYLQAYVGNRVLGLRDILSLSVSAQIYL